MSVVTRASARTLASVAALTACLSVPAVALAEAEGAAADSTQARQSATPPTASLGDIVVTARRRDERAQDVPIALTVVNEELLDRTGAYNVGQVT